EVWWDPSTYQVLNNTVIYTTGATAFGITLAAVLAWLVERTNIPGKIWIYAGVPMTLAMPGMLQAMAWVLLLSPRIGFLNRWSQALFGLESAPINIYSLEGMIFIEGLRLVPTAFLMLVPLLRAMDPALEEAAAMSGANPRATLRRVTLRLMIPGLLAVVIYQAMTALEVFEVPGILGLPSGIYVFSTKIYSILHSVSSIPAFGQANALAIIYVFIAIGATYLYARVISHSERFTIITGKGYRPRELELGRWRWWALGLVGLFLLFSIVLPFLVLLFVSFLPYLQQPNWAAFQSMSFEHYETLWRAPMIHTVLWNTLMMVVIASTMTVVVSFFVSLIIVRSKFWGRRVLDQMSFMPHAIPGIVMGLAFLWVFLQAGKYGIPIHGGIWAISIAFTVGFMAYGTRSMNAAILQIHKDLEEAAQVSGAPQWRTMWRIFYPLMLPTFVGVWIWAMLHAVRIAGKPLVLYEGAENQVLAILIWNMWDEGNIEGVGAIGALMIAGLLIITLGLRLMGFGRGTAIQKGTGDV
ncbi:MAG: iron ABC transporter permease, partial [Alphaproteobacteria bacterium]|nr:iron ABC transporter permease [Alphaproteobacteria bacterium]